MTAALNLRDGKRPQVFVFDLARALSAVCVLAAHARGFVLADLPQQPGLPIAGRLFFGLTALGHQAVIVFLVLSGVLVTRSMLALLRSGQWSAAGFAVARLNRLWMVLLPCLVLGGIEDAIGLRLTHPGALGGYGAETSARTVLDRLDLATFAGNVLFLQDFKVPAFGSNIPLWSLSIEAWCYAAALAAVVSWTIRREPLRLACLGGIVAVVAGAILSPTFWLICPIWVFGAALAVRLHGLRRAEAAPNLPVRSGAASLRRIGLFAFAALAVATARVLAGGHLVLSDYLLAAAVFVVLATLRDWQPGSDRIRRLVRFSADQSYTLYLAHFPLLALLDAIVLQHRRLTWSGMAVILWAAAILVSLFQALVLWWLFERHTDALRTFWTARLRSGSQGLIRARRAVLP